MGAFLRSICGDCCGLLGRSNLTHSPELGRQAITSQPRHEIMRQNAAAAADARMKSDEKRGLKSSEEFHRLQQRQARIEKANEEFERKGGATQEGGLRWQVG